jgi:23S rRNA (cytosine1962-C5)-methyltransferase
MDEVPRLARAGAPECAALANRLRKNGRHWGKWARRKGISCYRVYDRDIPELALAIDRYGDFVHAQRYAERWASIADVDPAAEARADDAVSAAIAEGLGCDPARVVLKTRARQRGSAQYTATGAAGEPMVVTEGGLRFEVNLGAYLDTGLFLDHRDTRALVRARASGRHLLNLFAYTGSFSVYAAAGGAARSLTVDMSRTYQHWTRRNFLLNGIDLKRHALACEDVFAFLARAVAQRARFDLVVLDPPSFSNSKRMAGPFDVQRDHPALLRQCLALLAPDGELYFSNNRRGFRLDPGIESAACFEEITAQTVPEDFRRHRPHRCWRVTKGA